MDVIDGEWIRARLSDERGERARLARHLGMDGAKLAKILSGERRVQAVEIPAILSFFGEGPAQLVPADAQPDDSSALVPIYDVRASAGLGLIPADYVPVTDQVRFAMEYIRRVIGVDPKRLGLITVAGDSMKPLLEDGDLVLIDFGRVSLDVEGLYVFRHGEAVQVKRMIRSARSGFVWALPANPDYPREEYPAEEITVIGRVVWAGGTL